MDIQFPEAQFKACIPKAFIPRWKRTFMKHVTQALICHDRAALALSERSHFNILRAVNGALVIGTHIGWSDAKSDPAFNGYDNWDKLVSNEAHRIYDSVDKDSVVE